MQAFATPMTRRHLKRSDPVLYSYTDQYNFSDLMSEVYEKGQVVIPKYLRDMFNIRPGSQVQFSVENNRIYIDPAEAAIAEVERLRKKYAKSDFDTIQREIKETERKRMKRLLDVPGL